MAADDLATQAARALTFIAWNISASASTHLIHVDGLVQERRNSSALALNGLTVDSVFNAGKGPLLYKNA